MSRNYAVISYEKALLSSLKIKNMITYNNIWGIIVSEKNFKTLCFRGKQRKKGDYYRIKNSVTVLGERGITVRYQIRHANVAYAADLILEDINFEIRDNEKIAVVGRNGCGKTTFLKLIAGMIEMNNPDSDEECGITMAGDLQIGYLKQINFTDTECTVEEEIQKVYEPIFLLEKQLAEMEELMKVDHQESTLNKYAELQSRMESLNRYHYRQEMETVFQKFGFTLDDLKRPIGTFSGGQQTKVAFIKLLLTKPDIMLLDEPTNHLDMPTIEWLEGYLKSYPKAVVIVSHDRMFLDRVIDVTYEIEYHKMKRYAGNYTAFMEQKKANAEKQEKDYEMQQKEIARLTEWIEKWKNTPTKVAATRSKRMVIEHMVKIEKPRKFDLNSFHANFAPIMESYKEVLSVRNLEIGYQKVLSKVNFTLNKGKRVVIVGENGTGKSTFLKTIMGLIEPLGGEFRIGQRVEYGYFDQQAALEERENPNSTILDDFWSEYPDMERTEVRQSLGNFLFSGEEVEKQLWQLSGGEKVRLALCKMLKKRPNFLILDEPTNHMDIVGKEALENMLTAYSGTVLCVSHDRYFIKQIATGILEFTKEKVTYYDCGYEEYLQEKQKEKDWNGSNANRLKTGSVSMKEAKEKGSKADQKNPTLEDVFDKKTYYNPGKIAARRKQQIAKYERQLEESEERSNAIRLKMVDPAISSDYMQLTELQQELDKEEAQQESLLTRIMELEIEEQEENQ